MRQTGFAESVGNSDVRWFLSEVGRNSVESRLLLRPERRKSVFEAQPFSPLANTSDYDLLQHLSAGGWTWRLWKPPSQRSKRGDPIPVGYAADSEKVFYTTMHPSNAYLSALCRADELLKGQLSVIAHGREEAYYKDVLAGKAPAPQAGKDCIADDVEVSIEAIPICNDDGEGVGVDQESEGDEEQDDSDDGEDNDDDKQDETEQLRIEAELAFLMESSRYGIFHISSKKYGYGAYQPVCRFHKLRPGSDCKRAFRVAGPNHEDQMAAWKMACWWCLRHDEFNRQRDHVRCPMEPSDMPSDSHILNNIITVGPPRGSIIDDDELDRRESAARGRGRGRRGRSGRGGKGRGGVDTSPARAASSSSSSSSSNSSTSD